MEIKKGVLDTSTIIDCEISNKIKKEEIKIKQIIIHEATIAELESLANKGKNVGKIGLEEIEELRKLTKLQFRGERPGDFEIKFAKSGEIDSLIREFAKKEDATLITSDFVQAQVAKAKGINYLFLDKKDKEYLLEKLNFEVTKEDFEDEEEFQNYLKELIDYLKASKDFYYKEKKGYIQFEGKGHKITIIKRTLGKESKIICKEVNKEYISDDFEGIIGCKSEIIPEREGIYLTRKPLEKEFYSLDNNDLFEFIIDREPKNVVIVDIIKEEDLELFYKLKLRGISVTGTIICKDKNALKIIMKDKYKEIKSKFIKN
ncbi:MAG: PIN domain-containing protein [Candidatus Woesearchaeota archaeon]